MYRAVHTSDVRWHLAIEQRGILLTVACVQYPLCLKLLESGKVDVMPMITHRFGFSAKEMDSAFDTAARAAQTGAIKVGLLLARLPCWSCLLNACKLAEAVTRLSRSSLCRAALSLADFASWWVMRCCLCR